MLILCSTHIPFFSFFLFWLFVDSRHANRFLFLFPLFFVWCVRADALLEAKNEGLYIRLIFQSQKRLVQHKTSWFLIKHNWFDQKISTASTRIEDTITKPLKTQLIVDCSFRHRLGLIGHPCQMTQSLLFWPIGGSSTYIHDKQDSLLYKWRLGCHNEVE